MSLSQSDIDALAVVDFHANYTSLGPINLKRHLQCGTWQFYTSYTAL